ncbi:unnamed protein product [Adineta steineri]|uniref:Maelstrom domain-containing protein n=1 Tax=Adineta steineri TaxID=433720 RepID=A0A819GDI5_9BILA|nr:unnamed protein product [Adineta steineri]CAF3637826.1 unnamed protein product [Adineta steineri]CAF3884405.1 unnamed protein product [Adineta steineri]
MPPKKKQHVNNRTGIYYLADEQRKLYPAYSRMYIQDLILLLLPQWRSMTLIERKPYEDLAKQYKRNRMLNNENAITPVIPSNEEALFIEQNSSENKFLDSYLSNDLVNVFKQDLIFVTFQIFCRTDDEDGGDYYPAEIAIMKYSFSDNIKQEYYTIMKPEKFPVGYTGTAIDLSRETHQIPPFDFIDANGDYSKIWQEVKRVIGDSIIDSSTTEPIIVFCNAFERMQTDYLLKWLASKDETQAIKPLFRVFSFEALVSAILRRLDIGDFAHQSVREQLRRPVYTLQVKERCIYHDSLAIEYCSRARNHGFSLFLDGFIRQRFIQTLPEDVQAEIMADKSLTKILPTDDIIHRENSICNESILSGMDSISSTFIQRRKGLRTLTQQRMSEDKKSTELNKGQLKNIGSHVFIDSSSTISVRSSISQQMGALSFENKTSKLIKPRVPSPIEVDCRWPISSLYDNNSDDEDQYIMTGRGLKKATKPTSTINSKKSDNFAYANGIGRGRAINSIVPIPGFRV